MLLAGLNADAGPGLSTSDSPLDYLRNKGLEKDLEIIVEDAEAFGELFELIAASVEKDNSFYPALAWCQALTESPIEITLKRGTSFLHAIDQVAESLGLSVVQAPWGCIMVNKRSREELNRIGEQISESDEKGTDNLTIGSIFTGNLWLIGVNPSDRSTLNFLEERITERSKVANRPYDVEIVWDNSSNPSSDLEPLINILGTQSASFLGNWRVPRLLDTVCLFYNRSWELREGVVYIVPRKKE